MSHISISKKDFFWPYIGTFFRVCTNIILLPIIVFYLSGEELGLWYVFSSIAQFVVLLDFGFAPTFARNIAYVWCGSKTLEKNSINIVEDSNTDWYEFKSIIETCKFLYLSIAIVSTIFLLTAGSSYVIHISSKSYLFIWIVYAVAVSINILYGYYTSLLRGIGAIAENNKAVIISKIVQVLFTLVFLILGYGLLGVSIAYLLSGIVLRVASKVLFEKYENVGLKIHSIVIAGRVKTCVKHIKMLWYNASRDGLITLSSFLSSQANTLLCSYAISLSTTGSYGLSIQIAMFVAATAGIPFSTYQSQMQEMAITGNVEGNRKLFSRCIYQYVSSFILLSVLAYVFIPLIKLLKPELQLEPLLFLFILLQFFIILNSATL